MTATQHAEIALASDALAARLRETTVQAVRDWQLRWPLEAAVGDVAPATGDIEVGASSGPTPWRLERGADAAVRLCWPDELAQALGAAMFGSAMGRPAGEGTAARGARAASDALLDALARAWGVAGWDVAAGPPAAALSRWQAPLDVRLVVEGVAIVARVPARRFAGGARRPPAATLAGAATRAAFSGLPVRLEVVLGHAELSVTELAGLQRGDVVQLDASVHDPLLVSVAGQPSGLQAWLGRVGQQRAVEFVLPSR